jgi:UDPglucose 6-dehydrogenase
MKYAANCFLAMKLSYVNAMAELCERVGADISDVTEGIGYDRRIGQAFLSPGPGWGGSCLPKDTHALLQVADAADFEFRLLRATIDTNTRQRQRIVDKVRQAVTGRKAGSLTRVRLGLLGLTFKAGTDDLRDSPALAIAALLRQAGADLVGYDPALVADPANPDKVVPEIDGVPLVSDPLEVAQGVEALVVLTEWPQFRQLDWTAMAGVMKQPTVVDTRNLLDPATLRRAGLTGIGLGRREAP